MFDDLFLYIPDLNEILEIQEGSGDNLCSEDYEAGIVDYMNYYIYDTSLREKDGGMLMTKEYVQEKYKSLADAIPDILDYAYGRSDIRYVIADSAEEASDVLKFCA